MTLGINHTLPANLHILFGVLLSVVIQSVIMLNVVMLSLVAPILPH
jgi:hypothetical protein